MRRNPGRWRKSLAHLMGRARNVLESFYEPEHGHGKHRGGLTGGGSQRMRVAKFLSRPLTKTYPREHHPTQAERNRRRNRRQRIARR